MNYSELLTNVRNYTEVDSNVLSNSVINVFITNVENKVAEKLIAMTREDTQQQPARLITLF
jgi:hypothetical protein